MFEFISRFTGLERAAAVVAIGIAAHLLALAIRFANRRLIPRGRHPLLLKVRTVSGLVVSATIFSLYRAYPVFTHTHYI